MEKFHYKVFLIISSMMFGLSILIFLMGGFFWEFSLDVSILVLTYYTIYFYLRSYSNMQSVYQRSITIGWMIAFSVHLTHYMIHFEKGHELMLALGVLNITFLSMIKSNWRQLDALSGISFSERNTRFEKKLDVLLIALVILLTPIVMNFYNVIQWIPNIAMMILDLMLQVIGLVLVIRLAVRVLPKKNQVVRIYIVASNMLSLYFIQFNPLGEGMHFVALLLQWSSFTLFFLLEIKYFSVIEEKVKMKERENLFHVVEENKDGFLMLYLSREGLMIEHINKSLETLLGYSLQQVRDDEETVFKSGMLTQHLVLTKETQIIPDYLVNNAAGSTLHMDLMIQPITVMGEWCYLIHFKDLSEKIENELNLSIYERRLFELAYVDRITGLKNKDYLETIMSSKSIRTVILISVLDVQAVINALGRTIGELYINELVNRMKMHFESVFHYERNLFLVVDEQLNLKELEEKLQCLYETLCEKLRMDQIIGTPLVAISAASLLEEANNEAVAKKVWTLIHEAEIAMQFAEIHGFQSPVIFNQAIGTYMERHFGIQNALKEALGNNECYLMYQPIINLKTGKISGVEALLRWNSHLYGNISPFEFIPLMELNTTIHDVGLFVFEKAFEDYKRIRKLYGLQTFDLHVNISPIQLLNPEFVDKLQHLMRQYDFNPKQLVVEISETDRFDELSTAKEQLKMIEDMGIRIAFDDFGSHHSSLELLKRTKVHCLKIDRRFFDNIHKSVSDAILLSGIIAMASKMGIEIIAESVESYEQVLFILSQKCQYVQGYYFEKPLLVEDLIQQLFKDYSDKIYIELVVEKESSGVCEKNEALSIEFGIIETDEEGFIQKINPLMLKWCHCGSEGMLNQRIQNWFALKDQHEKFIEQGIYVNKGDVQAEFYTIEQNVMLMTINTRVVEGTIAEKAKVVWYFDNIDSYKHHQQEIINKRDSYKKVFQFSPLPIIVWDRDYQLIDWNIQVERLFSMHQMTDHHRVEMLVVNTGLERLRSHYDTLILKGEDVMINYGLNASGGETVCKWHSQSVTDDLGNVIRFITIIEDVTVQHQAEAMKKIFAEQERLASVGHLAAGIAHEINNPLSYMLTNTQYLNKIKEKISKSWTADDDLRDDFFEVIDSYQEGLTHIKTIVSDLKSFVHVNEKEEKVSVSLNSLVNKVLNVIHNEIKYTSEVELNLAEGLPDIYVNTSKIQQVLLNLMINSNHAIMDAHANELGLIRITTYISNDDKYICCEIADNGGGMTQEVKDKIFEPFFTTKPEGIGTGLGIPISKEIIEEYHQGRFEIESELGVGTTIKLCLPIALEE